MITFDSIAPDGTRERLRFETKPRRMRLPIKHRAAGHGITWIIWSETLQRLVTIPEE